MRGVASPSVDGLPGWVTLLRAPNPSAMTLDGTNTWLLRAPGEQYAVVVDPGPDDEAHLAAVAARGPVLFVLVTHGHDDHVAGAARLARLLGDVPVLARDPAHCAAGGPPGIVERLGAGSPLGTAERLSAAGLDIRVLATPGHTADSVCFEVEQDGDRVVLTGDTILGRGTAVVAWPDGDLGSYLSSLSLLSAYDGVPALPGHGPVRPDCAAVARAYLDHRRDRLAQVAEAVAAGARTPQDVVAAVYPDVDPAVRFAALWSAQAQLDHLRRQGRESMSGAEGLDPL